MRKMIDRAADHSTDGQSRLLPVMRKIRKPLYVVLSIGLWLAFWQYKAGKLGKSVLLPYPKEVIKALRELVATETFRPILRGSLLHIAMGFVAALVLGCLFAVVCRFSDFAAALLMPPMKLVKTVPVVSFIILLLLWVDPARISIVISFLIVLPVVYANVSRGIRETSPELLEMAKVFRISFPRRLRYLYIPNAVPYATAAVSSGLSLCWKAGIAAEIIGLSKESIGRQLYDAKLYLDTPALFAWTIVVILVSVLMEWVVMFFLRAAAVALADPTLWHQPEQAIRYLAGLPVKQVVAVREEENEPAVAGVSDDGGVGTEEQSEDVAGAETEESVFKATAAANNTETKSDPKPLVELRGISKQYNRCLTTYPSHCTAARCC